MLQLWGDKQQVLPFPGETYAVSHLYVGGGGGEINIWQLNLFPLISQVSQTPKPVFNPISFRPSCIFYLQFP